MNRIRDKIEKDKANPKILITKRGVGYYVTDKN
jgi:DNA-binding response OmpR family regulator